MIEVSTVREIRALLAEERRVGKSIGLVPTMGFFHEGHLTLMRKARESCGAVVVSSFVNPSQFGPGEDYASYPRDEGRDAALAATEGVDYLFRPSADEMYPSDHSTFVEVVGLSEVLCGRFRPGHFRGVATVVAKLFNIVRPDVAFFGMKDYQQLKVIERMARDLNFDVEIRAVQTVREPDGLAMSSRNSYLAPEERTAALSLSRALKRAARLAEAGERRSEAIAAAVRDVIEREPLVALEYVEVCDPETLAPIEEIDSKALVALAARVGRARLIDSEIVCPAEKQPAKKGEVSNEALRAEEQNT